ncbi:MAG: metal-dependent transcriptional regulator [Thermoplasmata archaeon]|nr:MAG: metal-dependent transcriptional regulator [Thermoplasmata archaeon]
MGGEKDATSIRWEQYIETIDTVQRQKGYAKVKDVATVLEVGLPTVTEMFGKLDEAGLINYQKWSGVTLTEEGQAMADALREKHDTLREFLEILGVPEEVADGDACAMEHNVSPETLDRLTSFVDFVNMPEDGPVWLQHFREFYDTGETPACARDCLKACVAQTKRMVEPDIDTEGD